MSPLNFEPANIDCISRACDVSHFDMFPLNADFSNAYEKSLTPCTSHKDMSPSNWLYENRQHILTTVDTSNQLRLRSGLTVLASLAMQSVLYLPRQ